MSSLPSVALVGATGSLGSVVLSKLLAHDFSVTILARQGSRSTALLPSHPNQTIKEVDFASKEALTSVIKGNQVVLSTIGSASIGSQKTLIDAAVDAGTVTRFIPSDFGSDTDLPANSVLPVYSSKIATQKYLEEAVAAHPRLTWTVVQNSAFFDWGLRANFLVNLKDHAATLYNGGDVPFSTTTLATVADTVVAVLKKLDQTANRTVRVHDAVVTQNQIIAMVKKVDGKEWTTTVKSVQLEEEEAYAEMKKEQPNYMKAMIGFLMPAIFGEGRQQYATMVDNEMLGLGTKSKPELEEVVRRVVQESSES